MYFWRKVMPILALCTVDRDEKIGAIQAARIARFLRLDAGLPKLCISVMSDGRSPIGREVGVQTPRLYERSINPELALRMREGNLEYVQGILPELLRKNVQVLILGVSVCFVCCARIVLEGRAHWVESEPLLPGTVTMYDSFSRRVRYVDFLRNPDHAPWRKY